MITAESAETLDELTTLVMGQFQSACALVTRITEDRQIVVARAGRSLRDLGDGSMPLDYSICRHTAAMDFPLVIDDAFSHPLMRGNLGVLELGVASYIGAPVHMHAGKATGAICAVEFHKRRWAEQDISLITAAARTADRIMAGMV